MLPVVEMFTSIQGEGKYSGVPSHFVRVSGCNLRCVFKDSICDTPYSSFSPEKSLYKTMDDLVKEFNKLREESPRVRHLVVTGGEPLMYKKDLEEFLSLIYTQDMIITIETNGTMPILNPISNKFKVTLYSVSPKLSTSVGRPGNIGGIEVSKEMIERHDKTRINIKNLVDIAVYSRDYQFKFVYSGPECIDEIMSILEKMAEEASSSDEVTISMYEKKHPMKHCMLMPEGISDGQLARNRKEIAEACVKMGWQYTDRMHIVIWGNKRGI